MLPGKKYSPVDLLDILRRRAWLLVVPVVVTSFAALVVSASLPDVYESDMLIQIVPQRVPDSYVKSTVTMKAEDRVAAVTAQVMSRTQLEQMVRELDLYPRERATLPRGDVIDLMRNSVHVEPGRSMVNGMSQVDSFHLRFRYGDATVATRVTQRLGTLFIDRNASDRGTLAQATNQFLEAQLNDAREKLEEQERRVKDFRERHAGQLPSQLDFNMQAISNDQLQVQAIVESIARDRDHKLMLERLLNDAMAEPSPAPPVAAPGDGGVSTPQQQLDSAKQAMEKLTQRLKPDHPDVVRQKKVVADLEHKAAEANAAGRAGQPAVSGVNDAESARRERLAQMQAEIESLDRQLEFKAAEEQRVRARVAEYQHRVEAVPGTESEWMSLSRDYDTLQNAYRELLRKSQDSTVAAELERSQIGEQFRVLDAARVPVRPVSPNRLLVNGAGGGVGVLLALGLVAFLEIKDSTFRTDADVLDVLALPVVAQVPYLATAFDRSRVRRRRLLLSLTGGVLVTAGGYVFWVMRLWMHVI